MEGCQHRTLAGIYSKFTSMHLANWEFMTAVQAVHKVYEMFKAARETAAADSLSSYMLAGSTIPPFSDILYDIDCLFKVNRIGNGLDIVNELNFKAATAQDVIAKIENLYGRGHQR